MKNIRFNALLLVSVVILSVQTSIAQNTTFKLSDYKNPVYRYQALDLNFGMNSLLNVEKFNSTPDFSKNSYYLNSDAGAAYSSYANSPKFQSEQHISFATGIGSSHIDQDLIYQGRNTYSSSFSYNENLNIGGLKRFYNEKQNYIEVNASMRAGYNGNSEKYESHNSDTLSTSTKLSRTRSNNNISGAFFIGKGRIEQVQDAQLAMYLLDDLHRLNRDKRSVSDEDVLALARRITSLKYKRFFDNRLRNIAEIAAIDSFMQNNRIAGTPDAAYFTSLNDNWNYANNPVRYSGRRMFTGIEADFSYNYEKNSRDNKVTNTTLESTNKLRGGSVFLVAGLNDEKPLNFKWQRSANLKAGIGSQYQLESIKETDPEMTANYDSFIGRFPSLKLSADYGYGYYPNSRTSIVFNWYLSANYEKHMSGESRRDKDNLQNIFSTNTGPRVQAYYYLSEKLRLNFTFNGQFQLVKSKLTIDNAAQEPNYKNTLTSWGQYMSAALTYSLF